MSKANKYTKDILEPLVKQSTSITEVLRLLGLAVAGGTHSHITKTIKKYELDTSHFLGHRSNKGKIFADKRRKFSDILIEKNSDRRECTKLLVRALLASGREYRCEDCKIGDEWNNKKIVLHVDHINGDFRNNTSENLRFLCPNCHSQTAGYCRRKDSGSRIRKKYNVNNKIKCFDCENLIEKRRKRCRKCYHLLLNKNKPTKEELKESFCSLSLINMCRKFKVSAPTIKKWIDHYKIEKPSCTKTQRPTKDELKIMISTMTWMAIGRQFKVSDNAVRKWAKVYELL